MEKSIFWGVVLSVFVLMIAFTWVQYLQSRASLPDPPIIELHPSRDGEGREGVPTVAEQDAEINDRR